MGGHNLDESWKSRSLQNYSENAEAVDDGDEKKSENYPFYELFDKKVEQNVFDFNFAT